MPPGISKTGQPVKVLVKTKQSQNGDAEIQEYECLGVWHWNNGYGYLRYPEEESLGKTMSTLKLGNDGHSIRLLRHGDVEMDLTFLLGAETEGFMKTAFGRMKIHTDTTEMDYLIKESHVYAKWSYRLNLNDMPVNEVEIEVEAEEVEA